LKGLRIIALCLPVLWTNLLSQKLSHQVLVPASSVVTTNQGYTVSQSVGEVMIETISDSYYIVTQGFQQNSIKKRDDHNDGDGIWVYPNPAKDFITVEILSKKAGNYRIEFMDLTGRVFISVRKSFVSDFWYREPYNVRDLFSGFYLIRVMSEDGLYNRTFRIQKI